MNSESALISLGCNLGECSAAFDRALVALAAAPGVRVIAESKRRRTAPIGGPAQPDYLNSVALLATTLSPTELLDLLHRIEAENGRCRDREVRFGPRSLDLDILLHGERRQAGPPILPHPRLHERPFFMEMIAELGCEVPSLSTHYSEPPMRVIQSLTELPAALADLRRRGAIAFVPTMGALHEGHLSLVRRGKSLAASVVASIFVNPLQFGPGEDFESYPRDLERDSRLLAGAGCDLLFTMSAKEMYPEGHSTSVEVQGTLVEGLCATSRPGHFKGVTTVVTKLFNLVRPDSAIFGQKDLQQVLVLSRLARDLNTGIRIVVAPTIREVDGLALSSRNAYLSAADRERGLALSRGLFAARAAFGGGETDPQALARIVKDAAGREPLDWDYVSVVTLPDLRPAARPVAQPFAIACAARVGRARLIDNIVVPDDALA